MSWPEQEVKSHILLLQNGSVKVDKSREGLKKNSDQII
jgi:hypothetical protein